MRTREELIAFLKETVGDEFVTVLEDTVHIKPYVNDIVDRQTNNTISGRILFKGGELSRYDNANETHVVLTITSLNHGYAQGIKDTLLTDPNLLEVNKLTQFKFV